MRADASLRNSVADEQLRMVWSHAHVGTVIATVFAILFALHLRGSAAPAVVVDAWLVAKVVVAAVRIWQGWRYRRAGQPGGRRWRLATHALLALDGLVWGAAGLVLMSAALPVAALVAAVLACVSCVATFGLQFSKRSTAAYVAPILALTALGCFRAATRWGRSAASGC